MSSIRSRYPALDAVTHLSQFGPRPDCGLAASLLDLGASMAHLMAPAAPIPPRPSRMACYSTGPLCRTCGDVTTGTGPCDLCLWEAKYGP